MTDKAINCRREYMRAWRAQNKQRIKQYNKQYWEKQAKKAELQTQKKKDME